MGEAVSTIQISDAKLGAQGAKTPGCRLLDLLAGWGRFVDGEDEASATEAFEIGMLYQSAGEWAFDHIEGGEQAEKEAVRAFLNERVLPILLRKSG
jgi:hypothetical protein